LVVATGCGSRAVRPPTSADRGMVFGNIWVDGEYVPHCVQFVSEDGERYSGLTYTNGNYFVEDLPPGRYAMTWFCLGGALYMVTNNDNFKEHLFDLRPAEIRYLGSWEVATEHNIFTSDEFTIRLVSRPHPRDILQGILFHVAGTGWDTRIQAALGLPVAPPPTPPKSAPSTPATPPATPTPAPAPTPGPQRPKPGDIAI
jgi:hypothetical protein